MKEEKIECPACMYKVIPVYFQEIIRRGSILNITRTASKCPKCGEILWRDI